LLWRNAASGSNTIWRSGNASTKQVVAPLADTRWQVLGIGDFNGDHRADVLWQHPNAGLAVWPAANAAARYGVTGLQFVAIADVDGDGRDDLVGRSGLYFPSAFRFFAWQGASPTHVVELGIVSFYEMSDRELQTVGDFDGDGRDDLFWRNLRNGRNLVWRAGYPSSPMTLTSVTDTAWRVRASGDYDGDGHGDLLWRHEGRGDTAVWFAANAAHRRSLARVSTLWSVAP
jgi:hypothetical protein